VKRKIASILISLVFGWLTTTAMAEEENTTPSDSTAATSEPATPAESTTETASSDAPASDGTIAATPAESDSK